MRRTGRGRADVGGDGCCGDSGGDGGDAVEDGSRGERVGDVEYGDAGAAGPGESVGDAAGAADNDRGLALEWC